ncbi:2-oxoglutarate dehydrogenase E2 component (dihydrolipoamide succinyltransferase) [Nonlabens xylanidelens]|uniref:Dihydrolipoamide acetyltransferase component of pyruvate dehydrogenase complex n=2 Tax=Nonlabens xylanidelens TaxID=191564 RepID=A0A2S6ILS3_9FLAO|nr:dihydrolipoamide acetyltransferase family protein [Nonlabens xylanidelens]PPK95169.1 2-oxoglutarate dehydrogenase E2 component (dihydrolipoamide succinyltransferase) [Nonlabens xylanidelens]PQJ17693.1 2-oxoglutarate dehydrogenase [Nonlabens xylanidelens]
MAKTMDFLLPKMGESITEGTILNWLVQEGEAFEEGDILVEVGTDKVDNEVPAPAAGIMSKHLCANGDVVEIGSVIAQFEESDGSVKTVATPKSAVSNTVVKSESSVSKQPKPVKTTSKTTSVSNSYVNQDLFVSPLIDSMARKNHMSYEELARIPATGHEGRLRKSDVVNYINEGRPFQFAQAVNNEPDPTAYRIPQLKLDKGTGTIIKMDRMRSMIADHMVYSKHTSPHVTAYVEADLTDLVNWRNKNKAPFQEKYGERLTFTPLFVDAVARAIKEYPNINASVDGKNIIVKENINVGMATALPSGNLIVPVVKNADQKSLQEIAADVNRMANLARENKLGGDDIKGGTFTISNVGTFGSLMGTPIINQPEVAILATGIIKKRAEVMTKDGVDSIEIRSMMMLSLSFDHRVVDGFLGGSFLKQVALNLEAAPDKDY